MQNKRNLYITIVLAFIMINTAMASAGVLTDQAILVSQTKDIDPQIEETFNNYLQGLLIQIDQGTVLNYIQGLVSFGPRVTGSSACEAAGDYIEGQFNSMGLDVYVQDWTSGSYSDQNIEATIHGEDDESDEIYIVCAHYDSVAGSPGADDNAAGTAAVLAAAEVMSQYTFTHTVKFVAFSGEEQGLHGSSYYAQVAAANGDNIVKVLNADMIGYAETIDDASQIEFYGSNSIATVSQNICVQYPDILGLSVIQHSPSANSDHWPFLQQGYDAGMYHEYHFNPYYHSAQDTIDKMDMDYDMRVTRLILGTLVEYAGFIPGSGGGGIDYIPPVVSIRYPLPQQHVNNTVTISGIAFDFKGYINYVMIQINSESWKQCDIVSTEDGVYTWEYDWNTRNYDEGPLILSAVSINNHGHQSGVVNTVTIVDNIPDDEPEELIPWLCGDGTLQWSDVEPGSEVTASITISNCGDSESELDWEVVSYPDWGDWSIVPNEGEQLTPEDGDLFIDITVIVPDEENSNFTGSLVIENVDDESNNVDIPIVLATPKSHPFFDIIDNFKERFLSLLEIFFPLFFH